MTPLARALVWLRRRARDALPMGLALGAGGGVALLASTPLSHAQVGGALVLPGLVFARAAFRRLRGTRGHHRDVELGLWLVVFATFLAHRVDGSLDGPFHALVYVAIGVVSAFASPVVATLVALASVGLDVAMRGTLGEPLLATTLSLKIALGVVFALLHSLVLRGEIARVEDVSRRAVRAEVERLREAARSYRLTGASEGSRRDDERLARSGVEEIHQSVLFALRLLRESLGLRTAMLLWQNDQGTHLRISELVSDAADVSEGPFLVSDGLFAAVLGEKRVVVVDGLRPNARLPYYQGPSVVRSVCAVPAVEHGAVRGLLVVDRLEDKPFLPREQELVAEAAAYAVRAIHNERVFVQLERAKAEQGKLYRAAEALGRASAEEDVIAAGVQSAREVTSVDFAAVTLLDEQTGLHEIRAASGDGSEDLVGKRFRVGQNLVTMALENRHPLPYRGEYDEKRQIVFAKRLAPPSMPSILVLPMLVHDRPLGTLVLGSRRKHAFPESARATLEVLSRHVAVSLSNARMLRRLEELATTDGLTGLYNKRALLEMAEHKLRSAKRFHKKLSVLVADIDHFKRVNDTHGHDVGDVVIKGLGDVLRRARRNTDAVARFGGEEFVVLCEETDARGAMLLAERVREELERTTFHTPTGVDFRVTCSVGVATAPDSGTTWEELFKAADEALYFSKRTGRNRSTAWSSSLRAAPVPVQVRSHETPEQRPVRGPETPAEQRPVRSPETPAKAG